MDVQPDADHPGRCVILGLVIGLQDSAVQPARIHLVGRASADTAELGDQIATQTVDDAGGFVFPGVAPGEYQLRLVSEATQIHIQELGVGDRL
jgi:hypothetical protein